MTRLRLLFLLPFPPDPEGVHGGSRVIGQLLDSLLDLHDVGVVYLQDRRDAPLSKRLSERLAFAERVDREDGTTSAARAGAFFLRRAAGLTRGRPIWATDWTVPAYAARAAEVARTWRPDVVQAEFHVMGQYLDVPRRSARASVLVVHEPGAAAAADRAAAARGAAKLARVADARAWRRWEARVLSTPDLVVTFNGADAEALLELAPAALVTCIPFATAVPAAALDPIGSEPPRVLFVGSFVHPPNVEAAVRLATRIFPAVLARVPHALLEIVGSHPPRGIRRLAGGPVRVAGDVTDVRPHLAAAAVVAAPMRLGRGTRVKVLEALAAGKAIVASPLAVRGLDVVAGKDILVAGTDDELADALVSLLEDAEARRTLAAAARSWGERQPRWPEIAREYTRAYELLIDATPSSPVNPASPGAPRASP